MTAGAVPVLLEHEPSKVLLGYSAYGQGASSTAQIYDAAIAIGYRALQELCGPSWSPTRVQFSHVRPTDSSLSVGYSGPGCDSMPQPAVSCSHRRGSSSLSRGTDPALRHKLSRVIAQVKVQAAMNFVEQVECALPQFVLNGATSADHVARFFRHSHATLRSDSVRKGTHLQKLVDQTRFGLARQLLRETELPVSEIGSRASFF